MGRIGDIITNVVDDNGRGENFNFTKVLKHSNGQNMTDSKVDNVIYIKKDLEYFRRNVAWIDVKWFGAKGDGVTDDTEAIQKAIDVAIGGPIEEANATVREAKFALRITSGQYLISSTLKVWGVQFFQLQGDANSQIIVTADMTAAIDFNGIACSCIDNIKITGDASAVVDYGVLIRWNVGQALRTTTQNTFRNIYILDLNYKVGFKSGNVTGGGAQVDNTDYYHIMVNGNRLLSSPGSESFADANGLWQTGIEVGDGVFGNNVIHNFYFCSSGGNRNGFRVSSTQASITGGSLDNCENSIYLHSAGYFFAQGIRVENSNRLIRTGSGNIACVARLSDIDWHGQFCHTDNFWIYYALGGSLILDNVSARQVGETSGATQPQILVGALDTSLNIRGLSVQAPVSFPAGMPIELAFNIQPSVEVVITGYSSLDDVGNPTMRQKGIVIISAQANGTGGGVYFMNPGAAPSFGIARGGIVDLDNDRLQVEYHGSAQSVDAVTKFNSSVSVNGDVEMGDGTKWIKFLASGGGNGRMYAPGIASLDLAGAFFFRNGNGSQNIAEVNPSLWQFYKMVLLSVLNTPDAADDTAAAVAGIPVGGIYRTGNALKIRLA